MTMIDKVAKAIFNRAGYVNWQLASDGHRTMCIGYAEAAIEAMKEPTEEMIFNMAEENKEIEIWKKLINVALKE